MKYKINFELNVDVDRELTTAEIIYALSTCIDDGVMKIDKVMASPVNVKTVTTI